MGAYLKDGVEALRASDADIARVLTAVRGVGLMLGIEFSGKRETFGHSFLGVLAQQKILVHHATHATHTEHDTTRHTHTHM